MLGFPSLGLTLAFTTASAVFGATSWGISVADALAALEDGVAHKHGDHAIALRGVILTHPSRRFVRLCLYQSAATFLEALHPYE